jgi:hypothetical protein
MIYFLSKNIGYFFYHFGGIVPFKQLGKILYKIALHLAISMIKKDKRVRAIYTSTNLKSDEFIVGKSDIDILIIIDNMSVEEELDFNIYFSGQEKKILGFFPFLGGALDHHLYMFEDNFKFFQKTRRKYIERRNKHIRDWQLIYGSDCRVDFGNDETELDGYSIRFCYEQVLVAIYFGALREKCDFRMLYRYGFHIIRMFFLFSSKKEASSTGEYKDFLFSHGIKKDFLDTFFDLPDSKFMASDEFVVLSIYSIIKIIEKISEIDREVDREYVDFEIVNSSTNKIATIPEVDGFIGSLDKKDLESVYLSKILFINSHFLYLVIRDNLDYSLFRDQVKNIFNHLTELKILNKKIDIKLRPRMYAVAPDVFPLLVTQKMLSYSKFTDYGFFLESICLGNNAQKLFGQDLSIDVSRQRLREPGYFFNHDMHNLRIDDDIHEDNIEKVKSYYMMRHQMLVEKNKLCLVNVLDEYQNNFGHLDFDFNDKKQRYLFTRKYIKNKAFTDS